jgi:hypothetical protein
MSKASRGYNRIWAEHLRQHDHKGRTVDGCPLCEGRERLLGQDQAKRRERWGQTKAYVGGFLILAVGLILGVGLGVCILLLLVEQGLLGDVCVPGLPKSLGGC